VGEYCTPRKRSSTKIWTLRPFSLDGWPLALRRGAKSERIFLRPVCGVVAKKALDLVERRATSRDGATGERKREPKRTHEVKLPSSTTELKRTRRAAIGQRRSHLHRFLIAPLLKFLVEIESNHSTNWIPRLKMIVVGFVDLRERSRCSEASLMMDAHLGSEFIVPCPRCDFFRFHNPS